MKPAKTQKITLNGEITTDGRLLVKVPPEAPRGLVELTVVPRADPFPRLEDEDLCGLGLTAAEISRSPEIGSWKDDLFELDGATYVEKLRNRPRRYEV